MFEEKIKPKKIIIDEKRKLKSNHFCRLFFFIHFLLTAAGCLGWVAGGCVCQGGCHVSFKETLLYFFFSLISGSGFASMGYLPSYHFLNIVIFNFFFIIFF